jgi:hypothetical protein
MEHVHGVVENLSRPVEFPKQELFIHLLTSPFCFQLAKSRIIAHAGELTQSRRNDWRGVIVFLLGESGQILLNYALRLSLSRAVKAGQSDEAGIDAAPNEARLAERAAKVAKAVGVVAVLFLVSSVFKLANRAQLRRAILGDEASSRLLLSPSVYGWIASSFLSVFPFAPLSFLREPTKLFVGNLFDQAEV